MVKVITLKVITHGIVSFLNCVCSLSSFRCSALAQNKLHAIPVDSGLVFLTVVFITEDLETFCCRLCGTVQQHGFIVQDRSSGQGCNSILPQKIWH